MRKSSYSAVLALLLILCCLSCQTEDAAIPEMTAEQTKAVVLGKWKVQRVDYQVCRNESCTTTNYTGTPHDYFEFRADSAFLYRHAAISTHREAFRAEYKLPGAFVLGHLFWSATFKIKESNGHKAVLVCSYTGADPYAIFTDTYYLYR
ncbi:hypothetical protein H7F15_10270 [Pontibacter sp. Tf4]|uniref:hypothetical protein n=1 Tax=Pontibacter sp. Tf4 TaxID=2761620 RepID=UPI00162A922C|nr:hypothetical protein [Pontibacter sp. Tf4]MBB6611420.1 hypothetical protein [Pontibacter sp. Tf4]